MSAAGLVQGRNGFSIGAHADYRRNDFIFPRQQSHALRDTPWDGRIRPMRCWAEITFYAAAGFVAAALAVAIL